MQCTLCPRSCGADRDLHPGYCRMPAGLSVSKTMLHFWEEPCIGGTKGSGAIFFTGCTLKCVYCQNYEISALGEVHPVSEEELAKIMLDFQKQGAANIDLITPTHFYPWVIRSVRLAKAQGLTLPVVYNTSGYEREEAIARLKDTVDIYMPDLKYFSPALSEKYSAAPDYFARASRAIIAMQAQKGAPRFDAQGYLKQGVLIRHLVLPGARKDSMEILRFIRDTFGPDGVVLSLMSQYVPTHRAGEFRELNRKLTTFEYRSVLDYALDLGFTYAYMQQKEAAQESYIPDF